MSNGLKDDLAAMMADPSIPANVTNRMLLAVLSEIYHTISRMEEAQDEIDKHIINRIEAIEKQQALANDRLKELEANPSLVWLFRYRTKQTVTATVVIFLFMMFFISNAPDVVWAWLGLPSPIP